MHDYLTGYFAIGILVSIFFDQLLRRIQGQEPLTLPEYVLSIAFWPVVLYMFIKQLIKQDQ